MTGPEHYKRAEELAERAASWADADTGWHANLSAEERIARQVADAELAQAHATLALAAATAQVVDYDEWEAVTRPATPAPAEDIEDDDDPRGWMG